MIGFGRIGRAVADLLRPFGTRLVVYDPYVSAGACQGYSIRLTSLKRCSRRPPYLVVTAALTKETRGMLGRQALASLPNGTWVINVARGGLIGREALTREVQRGRLRCALDVRRGPPGALADQASLEEVSRGIDRFLMSEPFQFPSEIKWPKSSFPIFSGSSAVILSKPGQP